MQYVLLIYEDESVYGPDKNGPAMQPIRARHMALVDELGDTRLGGSGLKATAVATTVRTEKGQTTVYDGPFAETKEQLGGFYLIEAPDLDAALAIAKRVPLAANGAVEIRPLIPPMPR
ncbi:MAG TPA: YciI family protein [Aliidongia sp.]|uniref:YciI family protein n=1 Tax=Aliidongia sp. TaxID=1914230 RepID=UPI002DDD32D1|nr:YciI family protein [Aliidongia sp.]HEV2673921.1 YciI family protein [Aliidongia sp.]